MKTVKEVLFGLLAVAFALVWWVGVFYLGIKGLASL